MKKKTHRRIAKALLPNIDHSKIDTVNGLIDNPPPGTPTSPKLGRVPGLDYKGHRRKGHDVFSAAVAGYLGGKSDGVAVSGIHLASDMARDQIKKKFGSGWADVVEGGINILFEYQKRKRSPGRKQKKTD
jgi:hypothetical protein